MTAFELSSYRGFPLVIHRATVDVLHPETGKRLAALTSMRQVRLFVQGWRREERREIDRDDRQTLTGSGPVAADREEL